MPKIPNRDTTLGLLNNLRESPDYPRPYLGMSSLGDECAAKLWYGFHWVAKKKIRPRIQRIFELGKRFEAIAIENLKSIGVFVYRWEGDKKIELTGAFDEDQETLIGFAGHESGHTDGRGLGFIEWPEEECGLEFKSMNDDSFNKFKKYGCQESSPTYYGQTQRYMLAQGLNKTYFLAINKNTGAYYAEWIYLDKSVAKDLSRKARDIIMSDKPVNKAYVDGFWKCITCDFEKVCHVGAEPAMNCRTCNFSDIEEKGQWSCQKTRKVLTLDEQKAGCLKYKKGWNL
jgi:hypothetical protein